jgi:hypothetical protein
VKAADDYAAARAERDQLTAATAEANRTAKSAGHAYHAMRTKLGRGREWQRADLERARVAWALALKEWADLLVRREQAVDALLLLQCDHDQSAGAALHRLATEE